MSQTTRAASRIEDAELLHPPQVAHELGVTVNTLAIWRHHHQGPAYLKIGGRVRYEPEDVARFKEACRRECDPRITRSYGRRR